MPDGAGLEQLVERLERQLAPNGVTVTRREIVRDADGVAQAELDIVVSGNVGSSQIQWLIECRDRPSEGPAPGAWIEQLVGRRQRFHFDKVMAVSTTGFSPSAATYANQSGINLRSVRRLEDIPDEIFVQRLRWILFKIGIAGDCRFRAADDGREISIPANNPVLVKLVGTDTEFHPLREFIWRFLSHAAAWDEEWDASSFQWQAPNSDYICQLDHQGIVVIDRIECPVHIEHQVVEGAFPTLSIYAEGDREIGRETFFRLPTPEGEIAVRLTGAYRHEIGKWQLTNRYPEVVPPEYADHVMLIRPEGYELGTVSFPLDILTYTALHRDPA
jgi:Restriction endonuclease